jgi:hypothetical protein
MNNEFIGVELGRVRKGLRQRGPDWEPTLIALAMAELAARKNFFAIDPKSKAPYNLRADQMDAASISFSRTLVIGIPADLLHINMRLPFDEGFNWFDALLRHATGRREPAYQEPNELSPDGFEWNLDTLVRVYRRRLLDVDKKFDRLMAEVASAPNGLSIQQAESAISAMLHSPLLYPPRKPPESGWIALQMEWKMWMAFVWRESYAIPLFSRWLQESERKHGAARLTLTGPPHASDLKKFRRDMEAGAFSWVRLPKLPPTNIELDIRLPLSVRSLLATELPWWQYLKSRRMSWSDAEL